MGPHTTSRRSRTSLILTRGRSLLGVELGDTTRYEGLSSTLSVEHDPPFQSSRSRLCPSPTDSGSPLQTRVLRETPLTFPVPPISDPLWDYYVTHDGLTPKSRRKQGRETTDFGPRVRREERPKTVVVTFKRREGWDLNLNDIYNSKEKGLLL